MFAEFNTKCIKSAKSDIKTILKENKKQLSKLLKIKNKTFQNFVKPYMEMSAKIEYASTMVYHLDGVKNSKATNKAVADIDPLLTEYFTDLSQNEAIYEAFVEISNKNEKLEKAQKKVLELEIRDFKLGGCGLDGAKKARLKEINMKLSQLGIDFSQNLLDATNAFEMIVDNEDDVKNIPASDKELAVIKDGNKTKYKFTLKGPSYASYMTYGNNRNLREQMYKAYNTRAPENGDLITQILALRDEKAHILEFENYADLSLASKSASSQEEVLDFLYLLGQKSKQKAKAQIAEVAKIAADDGVDELQSYDVAYYSEIIKERDYNIKEEDYKPYFEKNSVVKGMFKFLKQTFDLKFVPTKTAVWSDDVEVFDIYDKKTLIGRIYCDLETRQEKKGGAWMNSWVSAHQTPDDDFVLPIAFIVGNFPPANKKIPSLLKHDDVVTLFHEMGHALHHLVSRQKELFVSGINGVAWDVVEFPSQFLENFAYDKNVLKIFAKHYKTKETLSDEMIDRLIQARNFQSAIMTLRQLEFAIFDFKVHQQPLDNEGIEKLIDWIRGHISVMNPPKYNKFQNGFSHIFAGGYAAGYYSYKWAEVLSADAFMLFSENGINNKQLAKAYKQNILQQGGSENMSELYKKFANREPNVESLLKLDGII